MARSHQPDPLDGYHKVRVIGQGAFGVCTVYRKPRDDRGPPGKVIIKSVLIPDEKETMRKVVGEARILERLRHPNIIDCYGHDICGNELRIYMHYAEGGTLHRLICEQEGVYLPEKIVVYYFAQLAHAIRYIHSKKILHRDLKTQNVLLNRRRTRVMLADFGISRELSTAGASTLVGTSNYLSPEVCQGNSYNSKSDMWALGCILYLMVELEFAFKGEMPYICKVIPEQPYRQMQNKTISYDVVRLIDKLLSKDPNERPDAERLLTWPLVIFHSIDITLDLGRVTLEAQHEIQDIKAVEHSQTAAATRPDLLDDLPTLSEDNNTMLPSFYLSHCSQSS